MTDEHSTPPPTRRIEPGLTRRMSMGMGTLTLAGAAFFGVAAHDGAGPGDLTPASSSSAVDAVSEDAPQA